jgi:hypothetical protein
LYNNKNNKKLAILQSATFQVGAGGFNGPRTNPGEIKAVPVPQRAPDHVAEEKTSPDQVNFDVKKSLNNFKLCKKIVDTYRFKPDQLNIYRPLCIVSDPWI